MQYQSKFEDEVNEIGGHNSAKDLLLRGGVPHDFLSRQQPRLTDSIFIKFNPTPWMFETTSTAFLTYYLYLILKFVRTINLSHT